MILALHQYCNHLNTGFVVILFQVRVPSLSSIMKKTKYIFEKGNVIVESEKVKSVEFSVVTSLNSNSKLTR